MLNYVNVSVQIYLRESFLVLAENWKLLFTPFIPLYTIATALIHTMQAPGRVFRLTFYSTLLAGWLLSTSGIIIQGRVRLPNSESSIYSYGRSPPSFPFN